MGAFSGGWLDSGASRAFAGGSPSTLIAATCGEVPYVLACALRISRRVQSRRRELELSNSNRGPWTRYLRPQKIVSALRRRYFEHVLERAPLHDMPDVARFGT